MTKFRKKPIVIEAVQFKLSNIDELLEFTDNQFNVLHPDDIEDPKIIAEVYDKLHSTWVGVKLYQWIIKGTAGEFYPHDADLFKTNYEVIEDE